MPSRRETTVGSARVYAWAACVLFGAALSSGCSSSPAPAVATEDPYETCEPGDYCTAGLDCLPTSLPVSSGETGDFCSSTCNGDSDCVQVVTDYTASCVSGQCYLNCLSGNDCPYGQACFQFTDQTGNALNLCAP
jgi:hypothetical protein